MSYDKTRQCLGDMQRYAPASLKPVEYDLAAALVNLTDAIQADFAETHRLIRVLGQAVAELQRQR